MIFSFLVYRNVKKKTKRKIQYVSTELFFKELNVSILNNMNWLRIRIDLKKKNYYYQGHTIIRMRVFVTKDF